MYGTGHMQRRTCRLAPACMRAKWMSHCTTFLACELTACELTRAYELLSFAHALAHRVVKNLLKHHESFTF